MAQDLIEKEPLKKARILVADDDMYLRSFLAVILAKLGFEVVEEVGTGEEAVREAEEKRPDLVLMDIIMPGVLDGIDAARIIVQDLHLPVVFMTGHTDDENIERAKALEPLGYLIKPFDLAAVQSIVEMALYRAEADARRREAEEALRRHRDHLEELVEERTASLIHINRKLKKEASEHQRTAEALKRSESQIRRIAQNVPGVIYQFLQAGPDGDRFLYISPGLKAVFGIDPIEIMEDSKRIWAMIHPEDLFGFWKSLTQAVKEETSWSHEWRMALPGGSVKWLSGLARHEQRPDGGILWDGLLMDISELKQKEERLFRLNRALKILSEGNKALSRANEEMALIQDICSIVIEYGGYAVAWVGLPQDDAEKTMKKVGSYGKLEQFFQSLKVSWGENPWSQGPTGRAFREQKMVLIQDVPSDPNLKPWKSLLDEAGVLSAVSMPLTIYGERIGTISIYAKQTHAFDKEELEILGELASDLAFGIDALRAKNEQVRVVKALETSEKQYRLLMETINEGFCALDHKAVITYANEGLRTMLGLTENLVGQPVDKYLDPEEIDKFQTCFEERTMEFGDQYELAWRKEDGAKVFTLISAKPMFDALSGFSGLVWAITDISQLKHMEASLAQSRKLEAMGQLAAGIAHEINTPTQYIHSNAEFMQMVLHSLEKVMDRVRPVLEARSKGEDVGASIDALSEVIEEEDLEFQIQEARDAIAGTLEGVGRISGIVGSMRYFAHPGYKEKTQININEALTNAVTISKNQWKYWADVFFDLADNLPLFQGYAAELNQALLNIIVNAAQAIAEAVGDQSEDIGRIAIQTRLVGDDIQIRISDTGPGIPKEIRSRIFDPFFTSKPVGQGTGQGLAVTHSIIVERHKGKIDFETQEGQGTSFMISLPREETPPT